jgi:hypothetical protein
MRNPIKIIAFGIAFFFVALFDVYIHEKNSGVQIVNVWPVMSWVGKTAVVLFCACLAWLFYVTLIPKRK